MQGPEEQVQILFVMSPDRPVASANGQPPPQDQYAYVRRMILERCFCVGVIPIVWRD